MFYRTATVSASGFRGSKYVFQLNLVCTGDTSIGFCHRLLWKFELILRSGHCSCSRKKCVLRNFVNFTGNHLYWSFLLIELQPNRLKDRCFPVESLQATASGTCSFTWSVLPNKLHFWLKLVHGFCIIIYSFVCQFSLLLILLQVVVWWRPAKMVFLRILQNSQENTCAKVSFLMKLPIYRL